MFESSSLGALAVLVAMFGFIYLQVGSFSGVGGSKCSVSDSISERFQNLWSRSSSGLLPVLMPSPIDSARFRWPDYNIPAIPFRSLHGTSSGPVTWIASQSTPA